MQYQMNFRFNFWLQQLWKPVRIANQSLHWRHWINTADSTNITDNFTPTRKQSKIDCQCNQISGKNDTKWKNGQDMKIMSGEQRKSKHSASVRGVWHWPATTLVLTWQLDFNTSKTLMHISISSSTWKKQTFSNKAEVQYNWKILSNTAVTLSAKHNHQLLQFAHNTILT